MRQNKDFIHELINDVKRMDEECERRVQEYKRRIQEYTRTRNSYPNDPLPVSLEG